MPKRSQSLREVSWRMTQKTYMLYLTFGAAAAEADPGSEAFEAAVEGLKMLPGYPGPSGGDDGILYRPVVDINPVTVH